MAKFLPIIGEAYTAAESLVLITSAGLAKVCGCDEEASELADRAGCSWKEYSETNLIATPINGMIQDIKGNREESNRLKETYLSSLSSCADGIPFVGHVKGGVHYIMGDIEKGNRSMEASTRTTTVLGAGLLTGGLGAGVAVGATAGIGTGVVYDSTATVIDKAVNGDKANLHGTMVLIDPKTPEELIGGVFGVVGDGLTGAGGNQLGKNIKAKVSGQKKLQTTYKKSESFKNSGADPKTATKITMDAAETSKGAQGSLNKNSAFATTEVLDLETNHKGSGHSSSYYTEMKKQNGTFKKGTRPPSDLQVRHPGVEKVRPRPQQCCAEHAAFDNLNSSNPNYNHGKVNTATVFKSADGVTTSMVRCGNCEAFGNKMGTVVTDCIPRETPVPSSGYVRDGYIRCAACGVAIGCAAEQSRKK